MKFSLMRGEVMNRFRPKFFRTRKEAWDFQRTHDNFEVRRTKRGAKHPFYAYQVRAGK